MHTEEQIIGMSHFSETVKLKTMEQHFGNVGEKNQPKILYPLKYSP